MKKSKLVPVFITLFSGIATMAIAILLLREPEPPAGEYHWSSLLRNNFGWLTVVLHVIAGFAIGYYFRLNPFLIGICLIAIFPIVAIGEATAYRGSHNMIPFEIGMYLIYALPAVAAGFAGNFVARKKQA